MKIFNSNTRPAQAAQTILSVVLLIGIHWATTSLPRGWVSWLVCLPAWLIIIITAMARLHDITETSKRWFFRRIGLILVGAGTASLAMSPLLGYAGSHPSWRTVVVFWGFALAWITTPRMPPWWRYISGEYKLKEGQQG